MYQYYDTSFSQFSTQTPRAHGRHLAPPEYPTRNFPLGLLFAPLLALFTCPILEKFWLPKPVLGDTGSTWNLSRLWPGYKTDVDLH